MKKLVLFSLAILTLSVSVNAQDYSIEKPKRFKKVLIGLTYVPEYFTNVDEAAVNDRYEYEYQTRLGQGLGLDIWYGITEDLFIRGGVQLMKRGFYRKEICFDCQNGFNYESEFKAKYVDIPLDIAYKIINERADLIVHGGFMASYLRKAVENRNNITGEQFEYDAKATMNNIMMGGQIGLGTNYNLTYRLSLGLTVDYRFYFQQVCSNEINPFRWRGVHSNLGVYYKF